MKPKCKNCLYWKRLKDWGQQQARIDKRKMGICQFDKPQLLQNIVTTVVREKGLSNIRENMEYFQFRPITESIDVCHEFVVKEV